MKQRMIILLLAIPAASVVMGAVSLFFAISNPDPIVESRVQPLTKVSWHNDGCTDEEDSGGAEDSAAEEDRSGVAGAEEAGCPQ